MKAKKLFVQFMILLLILSLWGGTMMFANSAAQQVRVFINGSESDESGILSEGKSYLPLRKIANSLHAMVIWDDATKQASLYKPNVHMFLFQGNEMFGNVEKQPRVTFNVMAQVDSLKTNITAIKFVIIDPAGKEELIQSHQVEKQKDNFFFFTKEIRYSFGTLGKYTIRCYMMPAGSEEWISVSEKTILSQ